MEVKGRSSSMLRKGISHKIFCGQHTLRVAATFVLLCCIGGVNLAHGQMAAGEDVNPPMTAEAIDGGARFYNDREIASVTFCEGGVVHVVAKPAESHAAPVPEPWIAAPCKTVAASLESSQGRARIHSGPLTVSMEFATGALRFEDASGKVLLQESDRSPRRYQPAQIAGQQLYGVSDRFYPGLLEGLYGLGQHQNGVFNYRGTVVELAQANSDIAIPLLLSTNGYGLFWNTASRSIFDDRFARELKLTADAADGVDYYFFYGPEFDTIIHHYRDLTGHAPLFGEWAYGFVQSKDRYTSAQQLLDVAGEYRDRHVPLDLIVQDWYWWKKQGDPEYSEAYLKPNPDVAGAIKALHAEHVHAMISVWAVLDPASDTYRSMEAQHLTIPGTPDYDPTNSEARDFYWNNLVGKLFAQGWDGFWLDSSEPETWKGESDAVLENKQLSIGPGTRYLNIFPLMHTGNIYDHWRASTDQKRVFILTRSAFAGQLRNSTVEWSGDIFGTFPVLRKQITAGLNFALSGMPYWTTDIAGYTSPYADEPKDPEYQELYTRWFEFGTFCPILRTHGHRSANELFSYGAQTPTLIAYDKLRSRLLPYTYSLAWKITHEDYTIQRPLVMDWRTDEKVRDIGDQFMFGPSILVNPVTEAGATTHSLYLPPAAAWYDFWTGRTLRGDQRIVAQAPLDRIPLYVRAGAILPLGRASEYAGQTPDAPIELRIYPGANGDFELYNDSGDSYGYEKKEYTITPIHWNDATHSLELGTAQGKYPGMPTARTFHIVVVRPGTGVGPEPSSEFKEVRYSGSALKVRLP
jgi:alpha-D-xyloside xylohydrolase